MNMDRFAGDSLRILELVQGVRRMGAEVTTIIPKGGSSSVSSRFEPSIKFQTLPVSNLALKYFSLSLFSQYMVPPPVYHDRFDIVQIESAYALPLSKMRRLAGKNNIVFDMHSIAALDLEPYLPFPLRIAISSALHTSQDFLCKKARCIVVSNSMKTYVMRRLGIDAARIHVIANGVNLEMAETSIRTRREVYEHLRSGTDPLLVYVGGLEWFEGVDLMIESVSQLKARFPNIGLVIAGKGSQESNLREMVQRLGIGNNVQFLGWVQYEDTFALQSVADILVAPRKPLRRGGIDISTPMKIPSYLSAGKPIIASGVGEIPFVVRNMQEALIVQCIEPSGFRAAVEQIATDSELARKLSRGCLLRAKEYSWAEIASKLFQLYRLMLDNSDEAG